MRLRRIAALLVPLAFTACLEGEEPTNPFPNVPIEQTTFATGLNVDLTKSTKTSTGLYYRDLTVGTGATATSTGRLSTYYAGYLADGTKFGELASPSTPFTFAPSATPSEAIRGFNEGFVGMKVGGSRQLVIPPELAYGANGSGPIPPNAVLVFTVNLVAVQ